MPTPYEPTLEEIRRETAHIRHGWSVHTENTRLNGNYKATPWEVPREENLDLTPFAKDYFRIVDEDAA